VKHVCVYNPSWHSLGGGEKYILTIAEYLARNPAQTIRILTGDRTLTSERIYAAFNIRIDRAQLSFVTPYQAKRALASADLSIVVSNFVPYGLGARKNILILQIPYGPITATTIARRCLRGQFREATKDMLRLRLLADARHADLVLVYSEFVRSVLEHNHRVSATVLAPAIDDFAGAATRQRVILSVGRIFRGRYNDKRYDVLVEGFKYLCDRIGGHSWEYRIVGNCGNDADSASYLEALRSQAAGYPIRFHVNTPYAELTRHYNEASIFWHGAGYGVDMDREPERAEHFGMTTVEAMSAGCVPIVINNGGQKEIVRHGESGFLWSTLDELANLTALLINNPTQLARLQTAARTRFLEFDRRHFEERLALLLRRM